MGDRTFQRCVPEIPAEEKVDADTMDTMINSALVQGVLGLAGAIVLAVIVKSLMK